MAKGYVFMNANITDPAKFAAYQPLSMQAIEAYGGKFLVRGGRSEAYEESMRPPSAVLEFADYETANSGITPHNTKRRATCERAQQN